MGKLTIIRRFQSASSIINTDDNHVARVLIILYGFSPIAASRSSSCPDLEILREYGNLYHITGETFDRSSLTLPEVIGIISDYLDRFMRVCDTNEILSLHASSCVMENKAIVFMGLSGSGKTSLAINAALSGSEFLGDEYAYLNLKTGMISHELAPLHLKATNPLIRQIDLIHHHKYRTPKGVEGFVINPDDLGIRTAKGSNLMSAIIFPVFKEDLKIPIIHSTSVASLPPMLLRSIVGSGNRAIQLRRMLCCMKKYSVKALTLCFGDACSAINKLKSYFA